MAKEEVYRQCVLTRETETGVAETTSWIPSEKISVGSTLKLQDPVTKEWSDDRWTVKSMGEAEKSASQIKERIRIARKYMKSTDI
jgi:hypothetical protein